MKPSSRFGRFGALVWFALFLLPAVAALHAQGTGLVVTSNNNVGIGTTSPGTKLDVQGDGSDSQDLLRVTRGNGNASRVQIGHSYIQRYDGSGAANSLSLNANGGNVGIGTTSPGALLDVYNTSQTATANPGNAALRVTAAQGANPKFLSVGYDPSVDAGYLQPVHSGSGGFFSNLLLNPNGGNVGIGMTNPTYFKLQVAGQIAASDGSNNYVALNQDPAGSSSPTTYGGLYFDSNKNLRMEALSGGVAWRNIVMQGQGSGNVGIGTTSPGYKLDVNGQVHATSFVSATKTYANFVFKPDYKLAPLSQVEAAIKQDGHLPGIPSEEEAKVHGIDLAQMQVKLLQKIEELTLHQIEQEKRIDQLEKENAKLRQRLK